jgi:hypothetical protein
VYYRVFLHALAHPVSRRGYRRIQGAIAPLASGSGRLEGQARDIYATIFKAGDLPLPGPGEVVVTHLDPRILPN